MAFSGFYFKRENCISCPLFMIGHMIPTLTYESFKHKKAPNSRDEPVLCRHITDKELNKEPIVNLYLQALCYQQPVTQTHNFSRFL